jgi:hypothetical protein
MRREGLIDDLLIGKAYGASLKHYSALKNISGIITQTMN